MSYNSPKPNESHETGVTYYIHCSGPLAYFNAAVGSTGHYVISARDAATAESPHSQVTGCNANTCEKQMKRYLSVSGVVTEPRSTPVTTLAIETQARVIETVHNVQRFQNTFVSRSSFGMIVFF